jgi:hypothetical protein
VPLSGSATGTGPFTYAWTAVSPATTVITNPTSANATFNALTIAVGQPSQTMVFSLTVTGCNSQTSTSTVTVTVLPPQQAVPVLNPIAPQTVGSGAPVTLTASGTGSSALTYTWTQTSGPAQTFTQQPAGGPTIRFTRTLPLGQLTNDVLVFSVVGTAIGGATSAPVTATVTVKPVADSITVTVAEYRTTKQRLAITATSSIISPNVVLTLQPYKTVSGTIFDPALIGNTFTNTGGGIYTMVLVGAPEPALPPATPLVIKSSLGGTSSSTALTRIRN